MAANPIATAPFDIGPLSWVRTEIEHSLGEVRTHLDALLAQPTDAKAHKFVSTHLHQVTGALSMVGLGAATRFNEEIERLAASLEDPAMRGEIPQRVVVTHSAIARLSAYLDNLMTGGVDRPMMLSSAYVAVNRARGAKDATEADLFSPDLSVTLPMSDVTVVTPDAQTLSEGIARRRSVYQAGLLKLLRDKNLTGGARDMRNATLSIEALQLGSPTRAFWYTAGGFFDVVAGDPDNAGALAVQLFGKIDQQIKLLIEGVQKVPEKLFRDLLLVIGNANVKTERTERIRALYRLDELLTAPEPVGDSVADDQRKLVLRGLRDKLQLLKAHWLKFSSGNQASLDPYVADAQALAVDAQNQSNRDLSQLFQILATAGTHLHKSQATLSEGQGLEVATALLFAESTLENYFKLSADFPAHVANISARVKGALTGATLPPLDAAANSLMDDITQRAQERILMFQVGQEVHANLAIIETTLDNFFREPSKTGELTTLLPLFSQVQGALSMLELNEAAALNQVLRERVSQFASGASSGTGEDAELVAEGVSALGLYIGALQRGASQPRDALLPALLRFGLAAKPVEILAMPTPAPVSATDVDVAKQKVQAAYEDWKQQPESTAPRAQLRDAVKELQQEATLIEDTKSAKQSEDALKAIDASFDPLKVGMSAALQEIAPSKPAQAPTQQAVQLMDAPAAAVDHELLEIFLEEATEVVATIRENLAVVRATPHDREALTTIRRGYHTLKGSGRMVGLNDLGDVAWNCEQVANKSLKDEKPASSSLLHFIDHSSTAFQAWVEQLQAEGHTKIDGTEIARMADLIKNDKELSLPAAVATPVVVVAVPPLFSGLDLPSLDLGAPPPQAAAEFDLQATQPLQQLVVPVVAEIPTVVIADAPPEPTMLPAPEIAEVHIGPVKLAAAFFSIYLDEANSHSATLDNEMAAVEANMQKPVSFEFMRAAHTLTSSSRTTGFTMIADVAHALEKWLQDAIDVAPAWSQRQLEVTREGVDAVNAMVRGLVTHNWPIARPDLVQELNALRSEFATDKRLQEAHKTASLLRATQAMTPPASPPVPPVAPHIAAPAVTAPSTETSPAPSDNADFDFFDVPAKPEVVAPPLAPVVERALEPPPVLPPVSPAPLAPAPPAPAPAAPASAPPAAPADSPWWKISAVAGAAIGGAALTGATASPFKVPGVPVPKSTEPVPPPLAPIETAPPVAVQSAVPPPVAALVAEPEQNRRVVKDDVDRDLLPIFLEEAREITPQVGDALRRWRAAPTNPAPAAELARHLHTLKGSARMAGLMRLGELSHVLETRVIDMAALAAPDAARFDQVDEGLDRFNVALGHLEKGELAAPMEIPVVPDVSQHLPAPMAKLAAARAEIIAEGEKLEGRERHALLRVSADMIDRFVNEAGELAIARSRIDLEVATFKRALMELAENATRMKMQLREIEIQAESQIQSRTKEAQEHGGDFDPLEFDRFSRMQELTRFVTESLNDVVTLQQSLAANLDETEAALLQQARITRELQQGLMGVRLVPLGNLQDRFYRLVRQTAKELDKKANLEFRGVRVEIDRSVLEKITAPFEHLLRNAVSHGLELPAERASQGKSEIGEITIDAQQVGNEVVLTLTDDGGGLNLERIRAKAIAQGLIDQDAEVTDAQLTQYIFMAGFSTADTVTQVSGRGVGMDIVRNEILSLGGRIDISTTAGRGTTFTIALPLTLAVTQAVLVKIGETTYAIPSVMIEQVQDFNGKRYEGLLERSEIDWKGNKYPLRSLEATLGGKPTVSATRRASVILAKSGQQRAAVQVDEIVGNREIVVKNIGPQLARLVGLSGATLMGSGQVILILNPVQLVYREAATVKVESGVPSAQSAVTVSTPEVQTGTSLAETMAANMFDDFGFVKDEKPVVVRTMPLVMVVDDSLTVRKITTRMLSREGFEVVTAKDGIDALQQLQDIEPDVILLDVEMPRMDGFEFARNARADARSRNIPIIMITSRTADKHRNRAFELGVNEYMGKPYQEEQLLAVIRTYTQKKAS